MSQFRMSMRRFTRLTNAFSKKLENHASAVALHFLYYNFARIHKTLRIMPAMAAGLGSCLDVGRNRGAGKLRMVFNLNSAPRRLKLY